VELPQNYSVIPFPCPLKYLPKFWYSEFFCGGDVKKCQIYGGNRTQMTLMTVYSAGVNSAFQAAQTNEQFGVELFGVNYSHLESSYCVHYGRFLRHALTSQIQKNQQKSQRRRPNSNTIKTFVQKMSRHQRFKS
jgi:hypothetical protein